MTSQLHFWQSAQWHHLTTLANTKKIPHAILIYGNAGLGKTDFVTTFSKYLLCEQPQQFACDVCAACSLFKANTHPDLQIIQPLEDSKIIKIDQIRSLPDFVYNKSYAGKYKIIIINPAEAMNTAAANAILKILEEPPTDIIMLLISNNIHRLVATVRSRCQSIFFPPLTFEQFQNCYPKPTAAINYAVSMGAPLRLKDGASQTLMHNRQLLYDKMLELVANKNLPLDVAQLLKEIELVDIVELLSLWIYDCIILKLSVSSAALNHDLVSQIKHFSAALELPKLYAIYDKLLEMRRHLNQSLNFNQQLWLEELFIFIIT